MKSLNKIPREFILIFLAFITMSFIFTTLTHAAAPQPTVSIINPKPGTAVSPTVISLRPTTNDFKVQIKVWNDAAISANTVQVGYYTGATPDAGPFTWVTATLNTNYPNAANYGVYEAWLSPAVGNYYLMARASEDGGGTYGYSRDNRTGNDARYIYVSVKVANTGTGMILGRDSSSQLCLDCHNLATHSSETTDTSYGNWQIVCIECHTPHSTKNIYLIDGTITTPNSGNKSVVFYNTIGDAVNSYVTSSAGGTTTGICQVCHTQTKNPITSNARWRNSGNSDSSHYQAGGPNGTQKCTNCHAHIRGFKGSCDTCHNSPPTTGKHATHFATGSVDYGTTAIQSITGAYGFSCGICHYGTHLNTLPQLPNPHTAEVIFSGIATQDSAGSASYAPAAFSIDDPGNGWTFNYSDGTCSNVYCHGKYPGSGKNASLNFNTGTAVCGSCHEASNTTVPASGSHSKHALNTNYNYQCTSCHNDVLAGTGPASYTIADKSKHVNGYVDWAFDSFVSAIAVYNISSGTAMPSDGTTPRAYNTCSNTYCHSNGTSVISSSIPANTSAVWGSGVLACNSCHGNTTYSDYRKAAPLYPTGSPKRNAHIYHTAVAGTPTNEMQCLHCHNATTTNNTSIADKTKHVNKTYDVVAGSNYWDFVNVGEPTYGTKAAVTIGSFDIATGKCMNVSCHPAAPTAQKNWSDNYLCTDCHIMDLQDTSLYHHSMFSSNTGTSYPAASPDGDATTGTFPQNRKCLMCHVDHNIFSPLLNTVSPGRGYNLRVAITTIPSAGNINTFANKDYEPVNGGICVSCHQQERIKDKSIRRSDNSTRTPVLANADFALSKHQYTLNSNFISDGGTFVANCSKCHDTQENEPNTFQTLTGNRFGVHAGDIRRLQADLGITAPVETEEEDLCYRCHSKSTDTNPGGGPPKAVANRDWFNAADMSAASQDIFTVMQSTGRAAGPTSSTNRLYFRPSASGETPSEPMPNAHQTGDTFAGGTWIGRSMNPWTNATAYETSNITTGSGANLLYRGITFTSPAVYTATTVSAGTWTIGIYCRESSTNANAYVRYMIYKWNANDTLGTTIVAAGNDTVEMGTTAAPGGVRTISVAGSAVSLAVGDKISVDIEVRTAAGSGSYTVSYFFGNNAQGSLAMPGYVIFNYADPGQVGFGHNVNLYTGLHMPSNYDETLTYISNNKHVECTDCHNPHAASAGTHTAGSNNIGNVLKGVTGATQSYGGATTNWSTPTQASYTLQTATMEYEVCFKCHAGANSNVTSWGDTGSLAWTDVGLEFNPNNRSGHPIATGLNNYANSAAPKALATQQLVAPWNVNVGTQTMTCSDCHSTSSTASKGPHGSSVKWMLSGTNKAWPYTLAANNGANSGAYFTITNKTNNNGTADGLFCLNCHPSTNQNNVHSTGNHSGYACVDCHIRVPHGGKVSRLMNAAGNDAGAPTNLPARYWPNGNGTTSTNTNRILVYFNKYSRNSYPQNNACNDRGCYGNEHVAASGENW